MPEAVVKELSRCSRGNILFEVPADWAEFPFENLVVSGKFLCLTYSIGTIVCSDHNACTTAPVSGGNTILFVADSSDDVPAARNECCDLRKLAKETGQSAHYLDTSDKQRVLTVMSSASIVHFAGHSHYTGESLSSGWQLGKNSLLDLAEMKNISRNASVPRLVFSNSCHAGNSGCGPELAGIAGAFMQAGVAQVIGPAVQVNDNEAKDFAGLFYNFLFAGADAGEALLEARKKMHEKSASITPFLYRLYGDPCFSAKEKPETDNSVSIIKPSPRRIPLAIWIAIIFLAIAIIVLLLISFGGNNVIYIPGK
jgi:CHAT domain-containing protein